MPAAVYNFPVHRKGDSFTGTTFVMDTDGVPMDLTGAVVKVYVRPKDDPSVVAFSWLTSNSSILILGDDNDTIQLQPISATVMNEVPAGIYLFDLEITFLTGQVTTYIIGSFIIEGY